MTITSLPRLKLKLHQRHCMLSLASWTPPQGTVYVTELFQLRQMGLVKWESQELTDRGDYYASNPMMIDLDQEATHK